ncbi:MAG: signal peptidase I [Lachnospiraceae bacterium]|nr:signal peptidase I [Lachnospiraceae bacterium]
MSICMVAALLISLFLTNYVAHHTSVEGNSMEPTLFNSDQLIVENISYILHDPERFDVIVFPYTQDVSYIKRIIGLPGERVRILNGNIYINGEILKENYGKERIKEPGIAVNEMTLGEDEYFVLGDNRNASIDSRKEEVGLVHRSIIKGKAWLRIYPFEEFGLVDESNETE